MTGADFAQLEWSPRLEEDVRRLVRLAVEEDLDAAHDWTTVALVPPGVTAQAQVVARQAGVVAGLPALAVVLDEMETATRVELLAHDGEAVRAGQPLAVLRGSARDLLTSERTLLNLLGRLSGIATLTRRYVEAVAGTRARIYDTRKTTPAWRRLEKYAVRCGGGRNHRLGLYDAVLIKDNHLALGAAAGQHAFGPAEAIRRIRQFLAQQPNEPTPRGSPRRDMLIEVEVDTLDQLRQVLPERPDLVLLDNMPPELLRQAVALRDAGGWPSELEASGGVNLQTVRAIAETGVERISVGSLTHAASSLDVALDWLPSTSEQPPAEG
jgi:nicotinate-nucleotide pyrophosphorylase (carboxylating)